MHSKIAVLGTGRSGTNFFATVMAELGRDVGHESLKSDGIASWCLVADVKEAVYGPGGLILDESFVVGHQVRDPLKTIDSLTTINKSSWEFIRENSKSMPRRIVPRSMVHWFEWNLRASEKASQSWKLESIDKSAPDILQTLGWEVTNVDWQDSYKRAKYGANTGALRASKSLLNPKVGPITQWRRYRYNKKNQGLSWSDLERVDAVLTKEIQDFASQLGYAIE